MLEIFWEINLCQTYQVSPSQLLRHDEELLRHHLVVLLLVCGRRGRHRGHRSGRRRCGERLRRRNGRLGVAVPLQRAGGRQHGLPVVDRQLGHGVDLRGKREKLANIFCEKCFFKKNTSACVILARKSKSSSSTCGWLIRSQGLW